MLLYPRQKEMVDKIIKALEKRNNAFAIAPTGSGKTIMFSYIISFFLNKGLIKKACVLVDKNIINEQNKNKFELINPKITTCFFNAKIKKWDAQVIFAMVQTLNKQNNLKNINSIDMLVIDEAHHTTQNNTYQNIIDYFIKINPKCKFLGMTATARRGDKKNLNNIFSQIDDQITIEELIKSKHLVRPILYTPDIKGIKEKLIKIPLKGFEYNVNKVEEILNTETTNEEVFNHWKKKSDNRQTIIFCSNLKHAKSVTVFFQKKKINAEMISSKINKKIRNQILNDFDKRKIKVLVNVSVLIEGWDCQIVSSIIILRPSSCKTTLEQMIGRGLRVVDHIKYPDIIKKDCIIIDFGQSINKYALNLFDTIKRLNLTKRKNTHYFKSKSQIIKKKQNIKIKNFSLKEIKLPFLYDSKINNKFSNFKWIKINFNKNFVYKGFSSFLAHGFNYFVLIIQKKDICYVIGGLKKIYNSTKILIKDTKNKCFHYANDWLNKKELLKKKSKNIYYKNNRWLEESSSLIQRKTVYKLLKKINKNTFYFDFSENNLKKLNKYEISILIICMSKQSEIHQILKKNK